ncbi:MAG: hypothetical protein IKR19_09005 [Acholeplasmatales bacterium]|nr:hypothetical protein [Acholeplasmatales bacterium]
MVSVWYDTKIHPNVRFCKACKSKVGGNKQSFDFEYCPYCGSHNLQTEAIDKEVMLKLFSKK